jgi:hypothetical protein
MEAPRLWTLRKMMPPQAASRVSRLVDVKAHPDLGQPLSFASAMVNWRTIFRRRHRPSRARETDSEPSADSWSEHESPSPPSAPRLRVAFSRIRKLFRREQDGRVRIRPHPALFKYDIMERVLSFCVLDVYDLNPWGMKPTIRVPEPSGVRVPAIQVPPKAAWYARAARTCTAWREPALQHLHRTIYLLRVHTIHVPTDIIIRRIGHRVRTLVISISPPSSDQELNIPFDRFTGLLTLIVVDPLFDDALTHGIDHALHFHTSLDSLLR